MPPRYDRAAATPSSEVRPWPGGAPEGPADTTHLSALDGEGNLVALTTTLNGNFGCGLLVPELEMFLNNEMDDFAAAPGQPNMFGLVQGEANAVVPGRRMLSSMTPTVAWRGDERLAIGAAGGPRIITATAQVLLGVELDDRPLADAMAAPRVHHQWLPDRLLVEPGLDPVVRATLERLGHRVEARDQIAEVHAVARRSDGTTEASADPDCVSPSVVIVTGSTELFVTSSVKLNSPPGSAIEDPTALSPPWETMNIGTERSAISGRFSSNSGSICCRTNIG